MTRCGLSVHFWSLRILARRGDRRSLKNMIRCIRLSLIVATVVALVPVEVSAADSVGALPLPPTLFFTWSEDPTTTVTVQWLSRKSDTPEVWVSDDDAVWVRRKGVRVPFGPSDLNVARVVVRGLQPDGVYRMRVGDPTVVHRFRTAPRQLTRPLRFVAGGDAGRSDISRTINLLAAERSPLFALLGGDLAYANGREHGRWVEFLNLWNQTMVTPDGLTIPLIVTIGNHEVDAKRPFGRHAAPYFYALFDQFRDDGYATLDFGDYMSFVLLDSAHTTKVKGAQTTWLAEQLEQRSGVPHLFAAYHVPAFPSVRSFSGKTNAAIREQWVPLFADHQVDAVFENHDHAYKRTRASGVLYLGDGAWGSTRRAVDRRGRDYLETLLSVNHFIETEIRGKRRLHRAIDRRGLVFDSSPALPITAEVSGVTRELFGRTYYSAGSPLRLSLTCHDPHFFGAAVSRVEGSVARRTRADRLDPPRSFALSVPSSATVEIPWPAGGRHEFSIDGELILATGERIELGLSQLAAFDALDFTERKAVQSSGKAGVHYRAYHGKWDKVPNFAKLKPVASGTLATVGLAGAQPRRDEFGLEFRGVIRVDTAGPHRFVVDSADGSALWIHDTRVVDNPGRRSESRAESGVIFLEAGYHPFRLGYFDAGGVESLELRHQGPNATHAAPIDPGRFRLE